MLGRLLSSRLRAAENALRRGRVDEAYRIATAPDLREHRRGTALLERLTEQLIVRARGHFAADRFAEALRDLDRAEAGGAALQRIGELRAQITTVAREAARQEQSRRDRLDQARRRIEQGSLAAGRRVLEGASGGDAGAAKMMREIEMRDQEASQVFGEVQRLMREGQWMMAVERFTKAKALDPRDPVCAKLEAELCTRVLKNARQSIKDGRARRAADELACLGDLGEASPARRDVEEIIRLLQEAGAALRGADYDGARQKAMRMHHLAPDVGWVSKVVKQLGAIDEMVTAMRAGPLGAFENAPPPVPGVRKIGVERRPVGLEETVALGPGPRRGGLPGRLLLLVDGGGSYLLLRNDRISIGRAATSRPADIPIFADLADRHADIARVEDDYFLFSRRDAEVGGRRTGHQLLQDGDRVVLGRKAKFTFRLPSRKSSSAALDLSDTSKLPNDVRRVVLFNKTAMIGFGRGAHVHCQMARNPLVLFERAGVLWLRPEGRGRAATEAVPLELGKTVEVDGVSMVAKPWSARPGAGSRA